MTTQPTMLEVRANMQLTDEQITALADQHAFDTDKRILQFARALLSASKPADQVKDVVTREQVIEWGRLAGFESSLQREYNLERLGDFAIFARMDYAAANAAPAQSKKPEPAPPIAYVDPRDLDLLRDYGAIGSELHSTPGKVNTRALYLGPVAPQPSPTAVVLDDERAAESLNAIAKSVFGGINALRWLLNVTTEFDRKDVRTRQAARLLDEYCTGEGTSNRVHLEHLWKTLNDTLSLEDTLECLRAPDRAAAQPVEQTRALNLGPSMTPFGMLVRALRIIAGTTLYDMAKHLSCTSAMLSAVEFGRQPVTDAMVADASAYFSGRGIPDTLHALKAAAQPASEEAGSQ